MTEEVAEKSVETTVEEKSMSWTPTEKELLKQKYGCEILVSDGTQEQVSTTDAPNDAFIVTYISEDTTHYDLTRSEKQVRIFDMYYDKFKSGLKSINFGMGRSNPKMWGNPPPKVKKKK